jgi:4-amino-4-deoxy-L-arabinose transferase-like glycosyltransferase
MITLRQHRAAVWTVLAVALGVRLTAAWWVERVVTATPGRVCLIPGDADGYWELARKIARGDDYSLYQPPRFVMRMPGFPVLLAGCRLLFGDATMPARCVLAALGTIACGLVYWLGCELIDHQVGLIAAMAAAVSPALVVFSPLLLSETAFAAALVASLIPWARLLSTRLPKSSETSEVFAARGLAQCRWLPAISAGLLAAVATYLRPTWLPVAPLAAALLVATGHRRPARWCEAAIVMATLAAALLPWAWRNHSVTGHWVATTLWVGPSLYDGLHPGATGDSDMSFFEHDQLLDRMSEYDMDREYRRRAWQFVANSPGETIQLAMAKAVRYWSVVPNAAQFQSVWVSIGLAAATLPLYAFAIAGFILHRNQWRLWALTAGPIVFFAAVHMVFVGSIRYRLPAEFPLWVLAAVGIVGLWKSTSLAKPGG